jgi:ATP-dependent Clp protease adaptor protein ClpS
MFDEPSDPQVTTAEPKEHRDTCARRVPPYHLILENDDYHSMQFVIEVLEKALGYNFQRAVLLMAEAHKRGRAIVWTGPREVAELKADQIHTLSEVREDGRDLGPLSCVIEPAPGG